MKLQTETFIWAKFDNDISTFFVNHTDQKFLLFQSLQRYMHSYSSPHSNWTSPWLNWKTVFVQLLTGSSMSAKFDNDKRPFFVDKPDQKIFLIQILIGYTNSYSGPHSIIKSPWLDWKTLFVKLHSDNFLSSKLDNMSTFFVDNWDHEFLLF